MTSNSRAERRALQHVQRRTKALAQLTTNVCEMWLIRHGETEWNVEHRLQGQSVPGPSLNDNGSRQVHALACRLQEQTFDAVYSSDLHRCVQTAQVITHRCGRTVEYLQSLRERKLGILEGLTIDAVRLKYPHLLQALSKRSQSEAAIEAGIDSFESMEGRVKLVLNELALRHTGGRILVVTHGGFLTHVYQLAMGTSPPSRAGNCSIHKIRIDGKVYVIDDWADDQHLDSAGAEGFGGGSFG